MIAAAPLSARSCGYGLTALQRDTLFVLQELSAALGRVPTLREIGAELFDVGNPGRVRRVLVGLKSRGYVDWVPAARYSLVIRVALPFPPEFSAERPALEVLRLPDGVPA